MLDRTVAWRVPDPTGTDWTAVQLDCDPAVQVPDREFRRTDGVWALSIPRPDLDRLEYRLRVTDRAGTREVLDPGNPASVATAFGSRSVLELPGYRAPWWLDAPAVEGQRTYLAISGEVDDPVPVTVWAPADLADEEAAPLLLVHDGPEYDDLARLTQYCGALVRAGTLPPHRTALLQPVQRDAWYSASPRYLRTEVAAGLSTLGDLYAVRGPVVVMGASLGGLTALLAGLLDADTREQGGLAPGLAVRPRPRIGGVFSQSGSFFRVVRDHRSVSGYRYYNRITSQVDAILTARHTDVPLRIGLTCGGTEENVANNRDMATSLSRAGHVVRFAEVRDLHNYTAWRDALDPHLTDVLRDCWGAPG